MYNRMRRMSSSVTVARTRMWRTIVAIIRGGNFWGAAWQRPQFARKRFSPWRRADGSLPTGPLLLAAASFFAGAALFAIAGGTPTVTADSEAGGTDFSCAAVQVAAPANEAAKHRVA